MLHIESDMKKQHYIGKAFLTTKTKKYMRRKYLRFELKRTIIGFYTT